MTNDSRSKCWKLSRNEVVIGSFADTINGFVGIKIVAEQSFSCTCNPNFHLVILKEVEFELKIFCVPVFVKTPF